MRFYLRIVHQDITLLFFFLRCLLFNNCYSFNSLNKKYAFHSAMSLPDNADL